MNPEPQPVLKIIVAVHGIGDQIANTTAQSVAFRVFDYYNKPPAIPLGRFHQAASAPPGVVLLTSPPDPKLHPKLAVRIGFAEVYWADIPRELVKKGFTLEEAKQWARTIGARLNLKASLSGEQLDAHDYRMLETVIDELVDAVFVFENLTFLADRAGLFKFDLKKVLNDFLNDVQVVTEFEEFRKGILKKFDDVMKVIADKDEGAEIYIVGHSEGSVVAYFGLLKALSSLPTPPAWVNQVRGLMTIGSPIEPHLLLWANLWNKFTPSSEPPPSEGRIVWWNYRDHGDPIAYKLTGTREWMKKKKWEPFFEAHDVSFARYVFPGKAHVDYWKDKELFAHFFKNVVGLPPLEGKEKLPPPKGKEKSPLVDILHPETPPQDRLFRGLIASVFPYVLVGALMFLAVYFLYTPVAAALGAEQTSRVTFGNLAGLTLLVAGMTAVVRIPRVIPMRRWLWFLAAFIFFIAAVRAYPILVHPDTRQLISDALAFLPLPLVRPFATLPFVIMVTTVIALFWSYRHPARGVRPLLVPGALLALAIVVRVLADTDNPSLWPVLLGSAAFLYLWWLATLLFDLSVVWHSYVRWSRAADTMREMIPEPEASSASET